MNKSSLTVASLMIAVLLSSSDIEAQMQSTQPAQNAPQYQTRVTPTVAPPTQNKYYFGMQLQLVRNYNGTTLRVASVTPGSPAHQAGLEYGDEIRTVNGQRFDYARDSFEAVAMMNRYVDSWISTPAPSAPAAAAAVKLYQPMPAPAPVAQMVVRNVRNGQDVMVTVRPHRKGFGGGGIAPAAPAQASPAMRATGR